MDLKIDHINLTVRSIDESRKWYFNLFEFKTNERGITSQGRNFEILAKNDNMICMLEYTDLQNDDW